jgi:hypothetical protein
MVSEFFRFFEEVPHPRALQTAMTLVEAACWRLERGGDSLPKTRDIRAFRELLAFFRRVGIWGPGTARDLFRDKELGADQGRLGDGVREANFGKLLGGLAPFLRAHGILVEHKHWSNRNTWLFIATVKDPDPSSEGSHGVDPSNRKPKEEGEISGEDES